MRNTIQHCLIFLFVFIGSSVFAEEYGVASYYSDEFHGRKTASGETYNKSKLTGAHKTLPFGTYVRVTRLDTKASVVIRINDRGPYIKGRIVDVSRKAAEKLDLVSAGNANVKIEVVDQGQEYSSSPGKPISTEITRPKEVFTPKSVDPIIEQPVAKPKTSVKKASKPKAKSKPKPKPKVQPVKKSTSSSSKKHYSTVSAKNYQQYDLYHFKLERPRKTGFAVQVASVSSYESMMRHVALLQGKFFDNILVSIEPGANDTPAYKILLGPFEERDTASSYKRQLKKNKKMDGFVVDLEGIKY